MENMTIPNKLSILRIVLTPIFMAFLFLDWAYSAQGALLVFIIASVTDWYDGYIARRYGFVSKWGKFLDPLADKILISSALFSFWYLGYIKLWMVLVIFSRDLIITGLRWYAIETGKPVVTSHLAKWKTVSQIVLVFVILIYLNVKSMINIDVNSYLNLIDKAALLVALYTLLTGIMYLFNNRGHIRTVISRFYRVFIPSDL